MVPFLQKFLTATALLIAGYSYAQNDTHVPGELLIQLNPGTDQAALIRTMEAELQTAVVSITCISDLMHIYKLQFADQNIDLNAALKSFLFYPEILIAQKNHYVYERETVPSDALFDNQWHHKNTGQTGGTVDADIDSPEAWDITTGGITTHGDTIVVCIVEGGGVDINHPDLINNIWKNYAEIPGDGIDNDNNGYIDDFNGWHIINQDDNITNGSHGTRVAGMIGATGNNTIGVSGVSWNVKMMVVEGQQASNEASVIAAYTYPLKMRKRYNESLGQEGAFVVATNSSWGIDGADAADSPLWCAMYDSLGHYGILSIAATTNDNSNVDLVGDMPSTCTSEFLVSVTKTNSQDLRAGSGYGTTHVDLGAPGQNVQTTNTGGYIVTTGTSFASPCVTGCVALAYSAPCPAFINFVKYDPAAAALDMRQYLFESVDQNAPLMTEVSTGGRANVRNFIDSILAACDPNTCIAPYNISATSLSDTSEQITWEGFSTDYIVYMQEGNGDSTIIDVPASSTLILDTLIPCTWYTVYVQANCGTDSSAISFPFTFQTDGCCNNPSLILDTQTETALTIAWDDVFSATSYDIQYKLSSDIAWTEFTNVTSPYVFNGLTACADYDFQIHTQCADSTHGYGTTQTFRTLGCGACTEKTYCSIYGSNTNFEWIQSIAINGFSNSTGDNDGWLQSNQIITALTQSASYSVTLTAGFSEFVFQEDFSIWIDFNQDGTFTAFENVLAMTTPVSVTSITGTINIPGTALTGVTKMRVGMSALDAPLICPVAAFFGEYEDYCVYIGPQTGLEEIQTTTSVFVYPNPANDFINIQATDAVQSVAILDYTGQVIHTVQLDESSTTVSLNGLSSGIYFLQVQTAAGISVSRFVKN